MTINIYNNVLICPKCAGKLFPAGNALKCFENHSYDRSREGYYNLLITSRGGTHGDNTEMVLARRAFLSRGYYEPLASRVAELVALHTSPLMPILDAGAGEGYYTDTIERKMRERDGDSAVYAFDISKNAVRELRRRNADIHAVVAGSYHMPIADGSIATLVNTFSPLARDEVHRVLRNGGIFVMAIPEERHLYELKAAIYDTPYLNTVDDPSLEGFELVSDERLTYTMQLEDREAISSLFGMTPYAYRTGEGGRERVKALERLDCTADFHIFVYRKDNAQNTEEV